MRRTLVAGVTAVVLAAAGAVFAWQATAAAATPPWFPTRLRDVGDARQLIVVVGAAPHSTYSAVYTYQRGADGKWAARFPVMAGRNGYAGWAWARSRVQGTGTTPAGTFAITMGFGLKPNPGARIPYRQMDGNDYWVGDNRDPRTYNMYQPRAAEKRTWRASQAERLAAYPTQYEYAAVIDFNRPAAVTWNATLGEYVAGRPADVRRGSAIFLHVNGRGSTAGCVSIRRADMITVLRWLHPTYKPRIVMAPRSVIGLA